MRVTMNLRLVAAGALAVAGLATMTAMGLDEAQAADLYAPRRPAPELRTFDATPWTGGYVGLSLGRSWGSTSGDTSSGNFTFDTNGGQVAGTAGYSWQSGIFVFGGEAEIATGSLKGGNASIEQDLNWMGAVRARAGFLVAQPLYVYGLAGVAWTDLALKTNGFDRDKAFSGFQLGAGAEYKFNPNWSLRLDYIYTGLGGERRDFPATTRHVDPDFSTVRAGINFRF